MGLKVDIESSRNIWGDTYKATAEGNYKGRKIFIIDRYGANYKDGDMDFSYTEIFVDDKSITNKSFFVNIKFLFSFSKSIKFIDRYIENPEKYYKDLKRQAIAGVLTYLLIGILCLGLILYFAYY